MTRKDYELIAHTLKSFIEVPEHPAIVEAFCIMLGSENARFNRDIFRKACGL